MPLQGCFSWRWPTWLAALLAAACAPSGPELSPETRLLLVTIDTLRADHVGAYGAPFATPSLDALATDGVLVEEAFTPTPTTAPAHASLFTGLHPWNHGVLSNGSPLPDDLPTLAERAEAAGIATAAFVSSYVLDARFGLARGFGHYHFEPDSQGLWQGETHQAFWTRAQGTTDAALAWLREHRDEPFLLWVHYFDPHAPYEPPPGFERPADEPVAMDGKRLPPQLKSWKGLRQRIRGYRGEVVYTDSQLGRLLEGLRRLDLYDRTAVVVTADHGEGLGDHGLLQHGANLHEELVRVPLVLRARSLPRGVRLGGPVQLEDLMPTLLALLGVPAPEGVDGVDLSPWLRAGGARSPRQVVLGQRRHYERLPVLLYERRWPEKWIGRADGTGGRFRLDRDPGELRGEPTREAPEGLRAALAAGASRRVSPLPDAETRRALEALGYVDP